MDPQSQEIGSALRRSRRAVVASALIAGAVVGLDLYLAHSGAARVWIRLGLSAAVVAVFGSLTNWDIASLGLRWRPIQGYAHWVKFTAKLGAVIVFLFMVPALYFLKTGRMRAGDLVGPRLFAEPSDFWSWAPGALLWAPISEEAIYRLVLCVAAAALVGRRATIVVSGCVFAALHVAYGNVGPDNAIAGFILGWAFLESRTIVVPVALHSLGNLVVGGYQLALCYLHI